MNRRRLSKFLYRDCTCCSSHHFMHTFAEKFQINYLKNFSAKNSSKKMSRTSRHISIILPQQNSATCTDLHHRNRTNSRNKLHDYLLSVSKRPNALDRSGKDRNNQIILSSYPIAATCVFRCRFLRGRQELTHAFSFNRSTIRRPSPFRFSFCMYARNYWSRSCLQVRYVGSPSRHRVQGEPSPLHGCA